MTQVVAVLPDGGEHVINWLARCQNVTSELRSTSQPGQYRLGSGGPVCSRRILERLKELHLIVLRWRGHPVEAQLRYLWADHDNGQVVVWPFADWPVCTVRGAGDALAVCGRRAAFAVPTINGGRVTSWLHRCDLCVRDSDGALPYVPGVIR